MRVAKAVSKPDGFGTHLLTWQKVVLDFNRLGVSGQRRIVRGALRLCIINSFPWVELSKTASPLARPFLAAVQGMSMLAHGFTMTIEPALADAGLVSILKSVRMNSVFRAGRYTRIS